MIFKKEFEIGMQNINKNKEAKNIFILDCLENIALKHSDSVGLGLNNILETGVTWMLLDWKAEILKRPHYGDKLEISTWTRFVNKCYAYRDYEIAVNNEKYAIATSKWLLFDIHKKKPIRVQEELISKYEPELNKSVFNTLEIEKMQKADFYENNFVYDVKKSDIDINGHMHNLNYLNIAYECFNEEDYHNELNHIRISYKKEIKLGDQVICNYIKKDNQWIFLIENPEINAINAYIELY